MLVADFTILLVDVGVHNISLARAILLATYDRHRRQIVSFTRSGVPELLGPIYSILHCSPDATAAFLKEGGADVILGFELMETLRACIGDQTIGLPPLASCRSTNVVCLRRSIPPIGKRSRPYSSIAAMEEAIGRISRSAVFVECPCGTLCKNAIRGELVCRLLEVASDLLESVWPKEKLLNAIEKLRRKTSRI